MADVLDQQTSGNLSAMALGGLIAKNEVQLPSSMPAILHVGLNPFH